MTGRPNAISDEAMAVLFDLDSPLDPHDRTEFIEAVAAELRRQGAELDGRAEIDVGLVHRLTASGGSPTNRQLCWGYWLNDNSEALERNYCLDQALGHLLVAMST